MQSTLVEAIEENSGGMKAYSVTFREEKDQYESDFLRAVGRLVLDDSWLDSEGRLLVDELLTGVASDTALEGYRPLVVVTCRDLVISGCESIFGWADCDQQICVVSTVRLGDSEGKRAARIENVIRHELGHLQGYGHCYRAECLMHPAGVPEDLDGRNSEVCGGCQGEGGVLSRWLKRAAAAAFLVAVFAGFNLVSVLLEKTPRAPFELAQGSEDTGSGGVGSAAPFRLLYEGSPFWSSDASVSLAGGSEELNRIFREIDPKPLQVVVGEEGKAAIHAGDDALLHIVSAEASSEARHLAHQLNQYMAAKGSLDSNCAACHLYRKPEVLEAAYHRKWGIGPF